MKLIRFRRFGAKGEQADKPSPTMEYMRKLEELTREQEFDRTLIL